MKLSPQLKTGENENRLSYDANDVTKLTRVDLEALLLLIHWHRLLLFYARLQRSWSFQLSSNLRHYDDGDSPLSMKLIAKDDWTQEGSEKLNEDGLARLNNKELNWSCERKWFVARPPTKWSTVKIMAWSRKVRRWRRNPQKCKSISFYRFLKIILFCLNDWITHIRERRKVSSLYTSVIVKWCYSH